MFLDDIPEVDRDYRVPRTRDGYSFPSTVSPFDFQIFEMGFESYRKWNHQHVISPYWRCIYNFEKGNYVSSHEQKYPLQSDQLLLIPEGTLFDTHGNHKIEHFWMFFEFNSPLLIESKPILVPVNDLMKSMIQELVIKIDKKKGNDRLLHKGFSLLYHIFADLNQFETEIYSHSMNTLIQYILQNLDKDLSNSQLAKQKNMNLRTFNRWFQSETKMPPSTFVTTARIKKARQQLSMTQTSIEGISESLGFSDRFAFSKCFKRWTGFSPVQYRKQSQTQSLG